MLIRCFSKRTKESSELTTQNHCYDLFYLDFLLHRNVCYA
jgi:hypothetical protein